MDIFTTENVAKVIDSGYAIVKTQRRLNWSKMRVEMRALVKESFSEDFKPLTDWMIPNNYWLKLNDLRNDRLNLIID